MGKSSHKESSKSETAKVHKHRSSKSAAKVEEEETDAPKIKVVELMPGMSVETTKAQCQDIGSYNATEKTWELMLPQDTKLTVKNFNGRTYVDIRKMWNGNPTKKGISLSPEVFEMIRSWTGMSEALKAIRQ